MGRDVIISRVATTDMQKAHLEFSQRLYQDILSKVKAGEPIRVDDLAANMAKAYLNGDSHNHNGSHIAYDPHNKTKRSELGNRSICEIIDGIDSIIRLRTYSTDLASADICIYLRGYDCVKDQGVFNGQVFVTQIGCVIPDFLCSRADDFFYCKSFGRTGYLLRTRKPI